MTDKVFWKKLDEVSRQEMTMMRELSFQALLKKGYDENKGILITCFMIELFPEWPSKPFLRLMVEDT